MSLDTGQLLQWKHWKYFNFRRILFHFAVVGIYLWSITANIIRYALWEYIVISWYNTTLIHNIYFTSLNGPNEGSERFIDILCRNLGWLVAIIGPIITHRIQVQQSRWTLHLRLPRPPRSDQVVLSWSLSFSAVLHHRHLCQSVRQPGSQAQIDLYNLAWMQFENVTLDHTSHNSLRVGLKRLNFHNKSSQMGIRRWR